MKRHGASEGLASPLNAPASQPFSIAIADIAIGERIGFFNEPHALRIGQSIRDEGQRAPIQVKRNGNAAKVPWTLVAGLHRVRGAELVGISHLDAIKVAKPGSTEGELRRLELAENISHRHRRPIERAIMMVAYARLEEEIDHPGRAGESSQERALRVRQCTSVTITDVGGWRERTAAAFDCSLSLFEKHQSIYRNIVEELPDLAQKLNDHPFGERLSAMRQIASVKAMDTRRIVAEKLLSSTDWKSMDEVFVASGVRDSAGSRTDPNNPDLVFVNAWRKLKGSQRTANAIFIAKEVSGPLARQMFEILEPKVLAKPRGGAA